MSEEMVAGTLGFDESYDLGNTRRESAKKSIKAVGYNNYLDSFRMYTVYGNNPGRTVRGGSSYNRSSKASIPAADADRATKVKLELGNDPLVSADARYGYRFVKRAFDILFSAVVLIFFSWLYVLIAIAVKVDDPSGPVFFKQKRVGLNGKEFVMYKFRSMCVDAEDRLDELREINEKTGPVFKIADDPRITKVGKWFRKLSLDELPQFINVLVGDLPLRILKMRQVFSKKKLDAFALPANEVRTNSTAFSQVSSLKFVGLRALRCVPSHSTVTFDTSSQFLAKRVSSHEIQTKAVA